MSELKNNKDYKIFMRTQLTINNEFLDGISIDSQGGLFKLEKDKIFIDDKLFSIIFLAPL